MPARCDSCGEEALTETARFCIGCGGALAAVGPQDVPVERAHAAPSEPPPVLHPPIAEPPPPRPPPPPAPPVAPRPPPPPPPLRDLSPDVPLAFVVAGVIGLLALLLILLLATE
jgi:hypothetical protein